MARRRRSSRGGGWLPAFDRGERRLRIGLMLAAVPLAVAGVTFSLAQAAEKGTPARAAALAAYDGRTSAALAARTFAATRASGADSAPATLARRALRGDPTAVDAVATLGLQAQVRGETASSRRLFAYAERLSRRDLQTQLWAIEDAVARGDVPGALRHYDVALRTSKRASGVLFPVLAAAIADEAVLPQLARTLAAGPGWAPLFAEYVAGNGPAPVAAARLLRAVSARGRPVAPVARALLVERLVSTGKPTEAWRYYASFSPGARADAGRDAGFTASLEQPTVFDWQPVATGGLSAEIERGTVHIAAPPGASGALLRQMQVLPPGLYAMDGQASGIDQPPQSLPYWQLTCGDGRDLGRIIVSGAGGTRFAGRFAVPAGCPVQTLTLFAAPSDAASGLSGEIRRAALRPAGGLR